MAEQTPDSGLVKTSSDAGLPNPNPDPNPNPNPNPNPEPLYNCTLYAKSFPYLRPGSNLRTEAAVSSCATKPQKYFLTQKFEPRKIRSPHHAAAAAAAAASAPLGSGNERGYKTLMTQPD